ncbi:hypothetical protein ITJ57_06030 [Plantibacter sp. VKM Ac-2880]|uniref:hypothetical protein n=1 Tax=Plantibacter sp. VKM Ac-2880 TaxID=2783827 RepID=UPI00188E703D|nr:hypothetical protein [Plantibacter sp. VKM Ac-2880]MBF4568325.1 hypothetical protein [Plantibacter sp. VKM Ac-2880]
MTTTRTRPAPAAAAFLLSADELHVLEHRTPHLVLPHAFHTEWGSEVSPEEIRERELRAVTRLRERRLLAHGDGGVPDDLTADVDPDFAAFLSMPQFATAAVDASCWTLDRTAIQSVSVIGAHALALLRTQRVDHSDASLAEYGTAARDEEAIEIRAFDTAGLAQQLLRPLSALHDVPDSRGRSTEAVVLPLADAEALVIALRQDRPDVVGAVVDQLHSPQAASLLGGLAKRIDGGFRLDALSRLGSPARRWTDTWLRSSDGWVAVTVDTPDIDPASTDPTAVAEASRVSLRAVRRADIVAEVLTIAAQIQGARA